MNKEALFSQVCDRTESPEHAIFLVAIFMSRLVWEYEGENEEKHGEQCVLVGDKVHDDALGEGIAVRIDGAMIIIEFLEEDGERVEKLRTKGHIYALKQRERALQKRTGRRTEGQVGLLAAFFGKDHEAPVGAEEANKRQRHGAFGKAPKATAVTPTATPNTAASPATATPAAPAAARQQLPGIALLGLEYASDSDEGEGGTPAAGALAGAKHRQPIGFRGLSAEKKAEVRNQQYVARKINKQDEWFKSFRAWLAKSNDEKGAHCKVCIVSLTKPKDKLSTTGYGWTGQGEGRLMNPIPSEQKLIDHENSPLHKFNMLNTEKMATGMMDGTLTRRMGSEPVYLTITPEDELYARTIRTVHLIVVRQLSLNDMNSLLELQNANGAIISFDHAQAVGNLREGGLADWLEAGGRVWRAEQRLRAQNPIMQSVFPRGLPFGFLGDGSNDRSLVEQEAIVTRHLGADGKPYNSFFDLSPLDLTTSYDKRSPDALCMLSCYSTSFDQLNQYPGFLHLSDWKKALIGGSFDGASVMLGSLGGTAKLLKDKVETHLTIIHAAAHVEQLALGSAFKEVAYYDEWSGIVQEVYLYYNASGKKRFGLEAVANELHDKLLKIKGTHGIRWAASQAATLTALLADLPSVVVDLEQTAKATVGCEYTLLTPSNSFVGKSFKQRFEAGDGGRARDWKATVKSVKVSDDGVAANDKFVLSYSNKTTMEISKAQLVAFLTDEDASGLVDEYTWQLRSRLINFRFAAFTAFMLDVHNQLGILSKGYQSNTLVIFDISKNLNRTLRALEKLKKEESCGPEESTFWGFVNTDDADCLRTCQLEEGESGRKALKADRIEVIEALSSHLVERFQKVLDDPILEAFSIFDVRKWPADKDVLKDSYIDGIKLLYKTYKIFYAEEETEEMVLEQWEDLKAEINVPTLRTLTFHQLWANMLVQYADEYALVLRLVVISLLIPADTSECERIFSLMNDLKTAERNLMGQQNLKNLMLWHIMGYKTDAEGKKVKMPCCDVPVMAILKEFRSMAFENGGMLGRKAHRAAAVPKYEYEAATSAAASAAEE